MLAGDNFPEQSGEVTRLTSCSLMLAPKKRKTTPLNSEVGIVAHVQYMLLNCRQS
jgi:hypothetical protein